MKRLFQFTLILLVSIAIASANSSTVLADQGEGDHPLEVEVNGIHVTLASQNDWKKGEDTITVTLMDSMGMPISDAEVEVVIEPQPDGHAEAESEHAGVESSHTADQGHASMPGMEMDESSAEASHSSAHETVAPVILMELHHGTYVAETHLASSGTHSVHVMFHTDDEMLQADFIVEVTRGTASKVVVLWGFLAINVALITSAGMMKKQSIPLKGK